MPGDHLLVTTPQSGLLSLGWSEQLVFTMHHQVLTALKEFRNGACVSFLAEPVFEQRRGAIDWYTSLEGPTVRYIDVAEDVRLAADTKIHRIVAALDSFATECRRSDTKEGA